MGRTDMRRATDASEPQPPAGSAARVAVTGGAGFIGHHLVEALRSRGSRVLVIDDLSAGRRDRLAPDVELARLDVASGDLRGLMDAWKPVTVYHLAAQVSVPRSETDPEHDLRVNGLGTVRLVAAARDGRRLPDVLDDVSADLGPAGESTRPLLAALADAARHGTSLGSSLERLAGEARTARRHRAEERARRVPILLLFPLVTCTLPALGLLTIAPLALGALRDLRA